MDNGESLPVGDRPALVNGTRRVRRPPLGSIPDREVFPLPHPGDDRHFPVND